MNGTVIGTLAGGFLLFLSSILVPVISKRLNKATDAATSAKMLSESAVALASGFQERIEDTEERCNNCLAELKKMKQRAERRDRSLDAVHSALSAIVPLLDVDAESSRMLREAILAVAQARYAD